MEDCHGTVIARKSTRFSMKRRRSATSRSPRPAAAELPADERRLRPVRHAPSTPSLLVYFSLSFSARSSFFYRGRLLLFPFKSPFTCSARLRVVVSLSRPPPSLARSFLRSSYPSSRGSCRSSSTGNGRLR